MEEFQHAQHVSFRDEGDGEIMDKSLLHKIRRAQKVRVDIWEDGNADDLSREYGFPGITVSRLDECMLQSSGVKAATRHKFKHL